MERSLRHIAAARGNYFTLDGYPSRVILCANLSAPALAPLPWVVGGITL